MVKLTIKKEDLDGNNVLQAATPPIQFPEMAEGQDGWEVYAAGQVLRNGED